MFCAARDAAYAAGVISASPRTAISPLALGKAGIASVGWISWTLYLRLERQNCRVGA